METLEKASHLAHEAVDKITSAASQATDAFDDKGEQIKQAEQRLLHNCNKYLHENPVTSLGIAVAAGFLLSRLLSSR